MVRRSVTGMLVMAITVAACGGSTSDDTPGEPAPTTSVAPDTTAGTPADTAPPTTVSDEERSHLEDRSTITQNDTGKVFSTTVGNRIELQLSSDWLWSQPRINSPYQLVEINFVTDPGFSAWEILIEEPGEVIIEASGVGVCDGCDDVEFTVAITAGSG